MRLPLFIIIALIAIQSQARQDLPADIRYNEASKNVNQAVKKQLGTAFTNHDYQSVFGEKIVCGPALWSSIKAHPALSSYKITAATFNIPITAGPNAGKFQTLQGALFQTTDEIRALAEVFATLPSVKVDVRKITSHEARVYWSLIPYDIEEPIFVIEHGKLHFLVDVDRTNNKVFWIDEVSKYRKK